MYILKHGHGPGHLGWIDLGFMSVFSPLQRHMFGSYVEGATIDEPLHVAVSYHPPCRTIRTRCRVWAHARRTLQLDMSARGGSGGHTHRGSEASAVMCCMCPSAKATCRRGFACPREVAKTVAVIALRWPAGELDRR